MENQTTSILPHAIALGGPTAVGKTKMGIALAKTLDGEVISADSRQFYRQMNIGTAKPTPDEMRGVPHHLIDVLDVHEVMSAGEFARRATAIAQDILSRGKIPILVGGSGLYLSAMTEGLADLPYDEDLRRELQSIHRAEGPEALRARLDRADPTAAASIDTQNPVRVMRAIELLELTGLSLAEVRNLPREKPQFNWIAIGLNTDRKTLYDTINRRVDQMLEAGLEVEVKSLLPHREAPAMQTMGYREWFPYFDGKRDREETVRLIKRNTRRFAKRQMTWFGKDAGITWFEPNDSKGVIDHVKARLGDVQTGADKPR